MNTKRYLIRIGAVIGVVATSIALAGCSTGGSSPKAPTTLTIAAPNGPNSLDPALNGNGTPLIWYTLLAYEPLIKRAADGTAKPGLATSWKYSSDRLSFIINLRTGVKFSDGTPLTADAVVAWLQYYKAHTSFQWMQNVSGIAASGALQVTLTLSTPDPLLPIGIDQEGEAGDIVSPAGLKDPSVLGTETHGAGPYVLDTSATIANSQYVYTANPNYWDKKNVHYKKVIIKVIADENSTLAALRSGQVDAAAISPKNVASAKSAGLQVTAAKAAMAGVYFFTLGDTSSPLANLKVRQALNMAVDRKGITTTLYLKNGVPTTQYVPQGMPGYVASLEKKYPFDAAKAKKLLADAGYPNGFSFKMVVQPGASSQNLLSQAVIQNWAQIGVTVQLTAPAAFPDYVSALESGQYAATSFNFYYSAQLTDLQQLFTKPALYNAFNFDLPEANKLATEQRKFDITSAEGKAAAETSETYMVNNALAVPISSTDTVMVSSKKITGVDFTSAFPIPDLTTFKPAN
ncbi:MAG: peptide/nickel transport system substrate-binding protein [Actinomycetota bacterium]|nr:peptide/nickel transport system substrate-binding protein [Actinomycetota bacterium]